MAKHTDHQICILSKRAYKIASKYLEISSMAVSSGVRTGLLPIGFAIQNEERNLHSLGTKK